MTIQQAADMARAVQQIAKLRTEQRYADAIPLAEECREYLVRTAGPTHPSVASTVRTLAELSELAGDRAAAEAHFRGCCEVWRSVMGEGHPSYANSLVRLGSFFDVAGDLLQAEPLYADALEILRTAAGDENADTVIARTKLSDCRRRIVEQAALLDPGMRQIALVLPVTGDEKDSDGAWQTITIARDLLERRAARKPAAAPAPAAAPLAVEIPTWKTVRVFLSSTFRDMHAERDHLLKVTFPRLRQWCQERRLHLVDIDLRWGVTREEAEHGKAIEICLREIDGSRPFFVGILGSRYGWVPTDLPPEELYGFRRQAESGCSMTHLEILHATDVSLSLEPDKRQPPCRHSFFYFRDPACLPDANDLSSFTDAERSIYRKTFFEQDERLVSALDSLKCACSARFPVRQYSGTWVADAENPEDPSLRGRLSGLEAFGDQVERDLREAIAAEFAAHLASLDRSHPLAEERSHHEAFLETRTRVHVPREEIERRISQYVELDDTRPLVVSGPAGSGKSATLAHWTREFLGHPPRREPFVVVRFIGASAVSTNLTTLLQNLCAELITQFQLTEPRRQSDPKEQPPRELQVPRDPAKLLEQWPEILKAAGASGKVVIVLDGLNQLDRSADPRQSAWIPQSLPPGVRMIVGALDRGSPAMEGDWLASLRQRGLLEVAMGPLGDAECRRLIAALPSVFCKTLDEQQVARLLENGATRNPLFLTVALEELRVFGSFERLQEAIASLPRLDDEAVGGDPARAVERLFARVVDRLARESERSAPGLARALFELLASSRGGLMESEMDALLAQGLPALDAAGREGAMQVVLRQVRPYLARKGTRSGALVDFFHRSIWNAVRTHYLADRALRQSRHRELARFFAAEPTYLADGAPNERRLTELPWQLLESAREAGGGLTAEEIEREWPPLEGPLCDAEFVEAKCVAGLVYDLEADYRAVLESWPGHDAADPFSPPAGPDALLGSMRRAELPTVLPPDTPIGRIEAFSSFVTAHCHFLAESPAETMAVARNYAAGGVVADRAGRLVEGWARPWVSRDPRPPVRAVRPVCVRTFRGSGPVVLSADGRTAARACGEGPIEVLDMTAGTRRHLLVGHQGSPTWLALSADGKTLLSASRAPAGVERIMAMAMGKPAHDESCVRQWDLETGACVRILETVIAGVAISGDGRRGCLRRDDHSLETWDLATGARIRSIPSGGFEVSHFALAGGAWVAATCSKNQVRLWDLETGVCRLTLEGSAGGFECLAITPDASIVAAASGHPIGQAGNAIELWNGATGEPLGRLAWPTQGITAVALSDNGRIAVSVGATQELKVWDVAALECVRTIRGPAAADGLALTASGAVALTADRDAMLRLWDLASGQVSAELPGHQQTEEDMGGMMLGEIPIPAEMRAGFAKSDVLTRWVNAVALTADGSLAVSAGGDSVGRVWDVATGQCRHVLHGHIAEVHDVAVTGDGIAVTAGADNTLRAWDVASGRFLRYLNGHRGAAHAVATAVDGRLALSGGSGTGQQEHADHTVRLWDVASGKNLRTLEGHSHWVMGVAFTPDGTTAVSGGTDDKILVWDLAAGEHRKTIASLMGQVYRVAVTPDGTRIVGATLANGFGVWELASGKRLAAFTAPAQAIGISADGRFVVSGGADQVVRVSNVESGACVALYFAGAAVKSVSTLRPDGRFTCGTEDGQLHFLQLRGIMQEAAVVTAARRFVFAPFEAGAKTGGKPLFGEGQSIPGTFDASLSCLCPRCGSWIPVLKERISSRQLDLLCGTCGQPLRLNPFVVERLDYAPVEWRNDAVLQGRFHAEGPDDVQVLVHDGHPGLSGRGPEGVWVRIHGKRGAAYRGVVTNQPFHLASVHKGDDILFVAPPGFQYLIQVSEKYLDERAKWDLQPCTKCGLPECFEAPSELLKHSQVPPEARGQVPQLTVPCPMCDGVQIFVRKGMAGAVPPPEQSSSLEPASPTEPASPPPKKRAWWKLGGT